MTDEQLIQKGFNHGYQLQKHQPELAEQIQSGLSDKQSPYSQGFQAGLQEHVREKAQEKTAYNPKTFSRSNDTSKEKGKDDKGLEL